MIRFELVKPTEADARTIMDWRNDSETLRVSFHTEPKNINDFVSEFLSDYFCYPDLPPLFAIHHNNRVGFLRFKKAVHPTNPELKCCDISINLSPDFRGKGIGTDVLKEIQPWLGQQGYDACLAEVKVGNEASEKAFSRAGFTFLGETVKYIEDTGEEWHIYRYLVPLKSPKVKFPHHVFLIAEAGSNWRVGDEDKSMITAFKMIEAAKEAGADAIKFQVFRPETTYVEEAGSSDYLSDAGIQENISEIFANNAMPYEMIPILAEHCNQHEIEFMASAFSLEDFKAIDPYVKRHKIASYEIGHIHLITAAAQSGKPTIFSTGAATEEEIAWAVDIYHEHGGENLTLMQCTAAYPAPPKSLHLRAISWLRQRFNLPVGLSDHSTDPLNAPIAALAFGAAMIEKHFTLDRELPGPDHAFAIEPDELEMLVASVRETEQMLGAPIKLIDDTEQELRYFARRGLQAVTDIMEGDIFKENENVAILRPGKQPIGAHPKFIREIEGKSAKHSIPKGRGIHLNDWKE